MTSVSFRTTLVGGFNRDDVVAYIERTSQEHRHEIAELQRGFEQSISDLSAETEGRIGQLTDQLENAKAELADSAATIDALRLELDALRDECSRLQVSADSLDKQRKELERGKIHLAELELSAAERAAVTEREAQQHAERLLASLAALQSDARTKIDGLRDEAGTSVGRINDELSRLGPSLNGMLDHLDQISDAISSLEIIPGEHHL